MQILEILDTVLYSFCNVLCIYLYIQYFTSISELATRNNWFDNMILVQGPKTVSLNGIETPF